MANKKKGLIVEFFRNDGALTTRAGAITWDGEALRVSDDFPEGAREELEHGRVLGGRRWGLSDGKNLLKRLPYIYSGSRFWAEQPRGVD